MKKVLVALAIGLVALAAYVATRPDVFRVERSKTIAAPEEAVYRHLEDFRAWRAWSPWERLDPDMQREHAGPRSGVGASYRWAGNDEVGEGRMTILEAEPGRHLVIRLEFQKPFEATNRATFALAPVPEGTRVTWSMEGEQGFVGKAIGLVVDMDDLVGADFEQGLASLEQLAESGAEPAQGGGAP